MVWKEPYCEMKVGTEVYRSAFFGGERFHFYRFGFSAFLSAKVSMQSAFAVSNVMQEC